MTTNGYRVTFEGDENVIIVCADYKAIEVNDTLNIVPATSAFYVP